MPGFAARPAADRFRESYAVDPSGCWLWQQHCLPRGYGLFRIGSMRDGSRRRVYAHRFSYELAHGPIPRGLHVMHSCDNPRCVNPAHLSVGTARDNIADMVNKGRHFTPFRKQHANT